MKVLTNNQYYSEIANVIREQNGTSNTYTPPQMVNALKDLFYEEAEGVPPITYNGIGENLLDYRIDGASGGVGDRTKNLLQNTATSQTINGVTFMVNEDGSVTCNTDENGATGDTRFYLLGISGTDFKRIECDTAIKLTGCPSGGSASTYYISLLRQNDSTYPSYNSYADFGNGFVPSYDATNKYVIYIQIRSGQVCTNLTFYPMIRLASIEDDTYEPYGYKVPVVVNGKNLLDFENPSIKSFNLEKISNGIYQANTNNAFLANRWALDTEAGVQYRILGTTNNSEITIQLSDFIDGTSLPQGGQIRANASINLTFTATGKTTLSIFSRLANQSFTATNFQIYKSSIADTSYEPYIEETTNIYLDDPIRTINDEVEYIDYSEQKQHRVRKNLLDFNWLWDYSQHSATNFFVYVEILLEPNTTYIVSSDYSYSVSGNTTAWIVVNSETEIKTNLGGVFGSREVTTAQDGILKIARRVVGNQENMIPKRSELESGEKYIQVEKGSVATEYEPYIEDTEVDVTLPAIPTIRGTNVLTVDTTVQPSNVYVKSRHESSYEAAMRERYEEAQAQLDALESGGE